MRDSQGGASGHALCRVGKVEHYNCVTAVLKEKKRSGTWFPPKIPHKYMCLTIDS